MAFKVVQLLAVVDIDAGFEVEIRVRVDNTWN